MVLVNGEEVILVYRAVHWNRRRMDTLGTQPFVLCKISYPLLELGYFEWIVYTTVLLVCPLLGLLECPLSEVSL